MATTKTAKAKKGFLKMKVDVPILPQNAGKPASTRKENAENDFRQNVFPTLKNHELWDITSINWRGPVKPQMKKYLMTVNLKRNKQVGPPSDPKVAQPTTPPPSA